MSSLEQWSTHQVLDRRRADFGGLIRPGYAIACTDHISGGLYLAEMIVALLCDASPMKDDADLARRASASVEFLRNWQRPTGLIDLPKVDFDSPPDTAFLVQLLCPALELLRHRATHGHAAATSLVGPLNDALHSAASGIIGHGFRTPNHRWVVCSALAQACSLFPDLRDRAVPYVDSILAETIDINTDGEFSERSTGVYNAVCCRSLRMIADHLNRPEYLEHVRANLKFMQRLMNPDGSVETSISTRQDQGLRFVPVSMADSFYDIAARDHNGQFATIADRLAGECVARDGSADDHAYWPVQTLIRHAQLGIDRPVREPLPTRQVTYFPVSGVWRVSTPSTTATALARHRGVFSLVHGDIELRSVRINGTYFHDSAFEADTLTPLDPSRPHSGVRLQHASMSREAPGWDLPLGRPVKFSNPHHGYYVLSSNGTRERWLLPRLDMTLDVLCVPGGFDLRFSTQGGVDRIPFFIDFQFFNEQARVLTGDVRLSPRAGQRLTLRQGRAIVHSHRFAVSVEGGADVQALDETVLSAPQDGAFSVTISLISPVQHTVKLRTGAWSQADNDLRAMPDAINVDPPAIA